MFIEALAKLTLFYTECKEKGIVIHSNEFMDDTKSLIDREIEILQGDGKFVLENPGPHIFGLGDKQVIFFPPELTDDNKWAVSVVKNDNEHEEFVFETTYGFMDILIRIFKQIESEQQDI